jgi:hypothetical protein
VDELALPAAVLRTQNDFEQKEAKKAKGGDTRAFSGTTGYEVVHPLSDPAIPFASLASVKRPANAS